MFKVAISKMNETKMSNSFKSYVGSEEHEPQENTSGYEAFTDMALLSVRLLPGEMLIAEAKNVLMFAPVSEQRQGTSGVLSVTNFKLSFITSEEKSTEEKGYQQNLLLSEHEVCLSNVDVVYQIIGDKKRRLLPGQNVSGKVKGLHVLCKNMRALSFSFKFSPVGNGKTLTNALLHHAYPRRHQLLFAYDFRELYYSCERQVCMYREQTDWTRELTRTQCSGWRLSVANQGSDLSTSLPQCLVVPAEVVDWQLGEAARHFRGNRPPVWVWGSPQGAALVRMADLQPSITDRTQENAMLESVRKSHPQRRTPVLMDLSKEVPAVRDVQMSYVKLRELCAPESLRQFWMQDGHFWSLLETTRWLQTVSICLGKAAEAAEAIEREVTVVVQEGEGRDMSCVVSSLAQLLLDDHWRSLAGFQSLIQKEWVSLGHPFCTRLGHVLPPGGIGAGTTDPAGEQSPVFLLFLDCVWQMRRQFPAAFQFSETYLTTLWDAAHVSLFDTFLFDCERDRNVAARDNANPLTLRSVWDWGEQFPERDISLFHNPLYASIPARLRVQHSLPALGVWAQCYFRWIPLLEIRGGGNPGVDLHTRQLLAQLDQLRKGSVGSNPDQSALALPLGSFYPFSRHSSRVDALPLNASFASGEPMFDSESILNAPD